MNDAAATGLGIGSALLTFFLLYVVTKPRLRPCPECRTMVAENMRRCPGCGATLKLR